MRTNKYILLAATLLGYPLAETREATMMHQVHLKLPK